MDNTGSNVEHINAALMHYLDPTDGMAALRMNLITVYDCMGSNLGKFSVPHGVEIAGYVTGSGGVPWSAAQLAAHPNMIRIDQSPQNTPADETADVLDVENQAATLADIPDWWRHAHANYLAGVRPGQREPLIYMNQSTLTPVANVLTKAGIMSGVGLWLAAEMSTAAAIAKVSAASGPWPIRGIQCAFLTDHDVSVFSAAWFNNRSVKQQVPLPNMEYAVQIEHYKDGFGWVLDAHLGVPATRRIRVRSAGAKWSDWTEINL